jgi:XrtN system VIT domain protein
MDTTVLTAAPKRQPSRETSEGYQNRVLFAGYILLAFSLLIFAWKEDSPDSDEGNLFAIFFAHYLIALVYTGYLIYVKAIGVTRSWKKENIHLTVVLLNLFLISAYALNRVVVVFEDSTTWLCVFLILTSAATISYQYFHVLPNSVNRVQHFLLGCTIVLYFYLAFYVANYYPFGFVGMLAIGIGAHVFVPLFLIAGCFFLLRASGTRISHHWVTAGATTTFLLAAAFVAEWDLRVSKIESRANQSVAFENSQLPVWVTLGQEIKNDWISQRILKSDLVYTTAPEKFGEWQFFPRFDTWQETRKHDPLVFLSSIRRKTSLSKNDRIRILQAISNARHQSEERLWSGDHLSTSYIVSDIDLYPDLRLAYTEKYFNIRNNDISQRPRSNSQEALYTLQLPEGSVVTSLSLWIDGREEKGILTAKQKAVKAYKTIVGTERRDPSVVHWQEGNTVTVRVFPCTNSEERRFKIGITSPLPLVNGNTVYRNLNFSGPDASDARETIRVRIVGSKNNVHLPGRFHKNDKGQYLSEETFDPDFEISFPETPVTPRSFTFDGFAYSLHDYIPVSEPVKIRKVYFDLNNSWTTKEFEGIKSVCADREVYVYADGNFVPVSDGNRGVTSELLAKNFSLFPFYLIDHPEDALVITKGDIFTPHLSDFRESAFAFRMEKFFASTKKVKVFNLAGGMSTYINSLREMRAIEVNTGTVPELKRVLDHKQFHRFSEDDSTIILSEARLSITRETASPRVDKDTAPDHLARLFAYNDIMRRIGSGYFRDDFIDESLVSEASKAYVVSPVSSLIVLESQADYDRFDIHDQGTSLFNASKQSSGAVPEPQEWALILLFVLFVIYVRYR